MLLFNAHQNAEADNETASWQWCFLDASGEISQGEVTYEELPTLLAERPDWFASPQQVGLVLPSEDVLRLGASVPGKTVNSIKQALPYALEEFLTSDLEDLHIAHGRIKPGHSVSCAVIEGSRLQAALEPFTTQNVRIGWVVSQAQLLAPDAEEATLLFSSGDSGQVLIVTQDQDAVIDRSFLPGMLDSLAPNKITLIGGALTDLEASQLSSEPELEPIDKSPAMYFAQQLQNAANAVDGDVFNLLQGPYAVRFDDQGLASRWRLLGAVAALWLCVFTLGLLLQGYGFKFKADKQEAASFAAYEQLFPKDSKPVTVTQLQRRFMGKLGDGEGQDSRFSMMDLLLRTTSVLGPESKIQSLRYRKKQNSLTVDVLIRGFDELDQIKSRSQQLGIIVDVSDATKERNLVRARLVGQYQ